MPDFYPFSLHHVACGTFMQLVALSPCILRCKIYLILHLEIIDDGKCASREAQS